MAEIKFEYLTQKKPSKDPVQGATAKARETARNGLTPKKTPVEDQSLLGDLRGIGDKLRSAFRDGADNLVKNAVVVPALKMAEVGKYMEDTLTAPGTPNAGAGGTPQTITPAKPSMQPTLAPEQPKSAAPFTKEGVLPGEFGEQNGIVRYEFPNGSYFQSGLMPTEKVNEILDRTPGETFTDLRQPTRSGGDYFGRYDVRNMTPEQYLKFKVDYMNRVADQLRANREAALGGGVRGRTPSVGPDPQRQQLLKQYKQEMKNIVDQMKSGELTLRAGKAALASLKGYYGEALGLSPKTELEAGLADKAAERAALLKRAELEYASRGQGIAGRYALKSYTNPETGDTYLVRFDKKTGEVAPLNVDRQLRIAKLQRMAEQDPDNAEEYQAEIDKLIGGGE